VDHAAYGRGVFQFNRMTDATQAQAFHSSLVLGHNADGAADLGNLDRCCHGALPRDRFDRQTALGGHVFRCLHGGETFNSRSYHVNRVGGTVALGQYVVDTGEL